MSVTPPDEPRRFPLRIVAAVFAALTLLLIGWYFLAFRQDYSLLYSGLRTSDAAAIVEELDKQGIHYRLRNGGADILVPAGQADRARIELGAANVAPGGVEGFELFNESDMGLTDFAQKIRYQRALQGELARTIMMMDGVAEARVHISIPERTLFRAERHNAEAAVELIMRSPEDETPQRIEGIQRLVAASVPDLAVADVVVLNGRGEVISPRVEIATAPGATSLSSDPEAPSIDYVMEIVRRALPNRRFEVSIEQVPPQLAGAAPTDANGDPVPPEPARVVTVMTGTALSADEMERASNALRRSNIVDGISGGTLAFRIAPPSTFPLEHAERRVNERASPRQPMPTTPWWPWLTAMLLLTAASIFLWLRFGRSKLTFADHQRFAERLKAGLTLQEVGGGDA